MRLALVCALLWLALGPLLADPIAPNASPTPAPSPDAVSTLQRLRVAPGLKLSIWASEPLVRNITSVSFDSIGRAYVVETGRRRTSVFDVRNLPRWLDEDFSLRTENERSSFLQRVLTPTEPDYPAFLEAVNKGGRGGFQDFNKDGTIDWKDLTAESERIVRVIDSNRNGTADRSEVFADNFNGITSGVAAGVLAEGTNVWFTSIPNVWKFPALEVPPAPNKPTLNDPGFGHSLFSGFGVHVAFGGHDLHGLIRGPDGRIYFSIADRGSHVTNREGRVLSQPDTGAIFRCETDGSHLELVATGLRNPQELAFDAHGNLWTGDNNGDGGDKARWTWVVQGADYGWTIGWQWLPKMGAWNSERLWHTRPSNSASYIFPPVAHIGHGPAGIAFYPGVGLGNAYQDHFFYSDFPGGIRAFKVEPVDAFFRVSTPRAATDPVQWMEDNSVTNLAGKILWDLSPVDIAFPPFGGVIVADWVQGWEKTGKGRLWHLTDPTLAKDSAIAEVQRILGEGFSNRSESQLSGWLAHIDQRIRLEAQWELASRGRNGFDEFHRIASRSTNRLARIHSLWGMGHIVRLDPNPAFNELLFRLIPLTKDPDPEVRAQSVLLLGECRLVEAQEAIRDGISDPDERVAFQATMAWAKLLYPIEAPFRDLRFQNSSTQKAYTKAYVSLPQQLQSLLPDPTSSNSPQSALDALKRRLARPGSTNPALLHAASLALESLCKSVRDWPRYIASPIHSDPSRTTRLALLLAERRMQHPEIARFLSDPDPQLVLEAARAIHDAPIPSALPSVAGFLDLFGAQPPVSPVASTVRQWMASPDAIPWVQGSNYQRDEWRHWILRRSINAGFRLGGPQNAGRIAQLAASTQVPETTRIEALSALSSWANPPSRDRIVGVHRPIPSRDPAPAHAALQAIWPILTPSTASSTLLIQALQTAATFTNATWNEAIAHFTTHTHPTVRQEATRLLTAKTQVPLDAVLAQLKQDHLPTRRDALRQLSNRPSPTTTEALQPWVEQLLQGTLPKELQLDVFTTASAQNNAVLANQLSKFTNSFAASDPLGLRRLALHGGDATQGRRVFAERADLGCQRCHKLHGDGGDVGPELQGLGRSKGREYLLHSILNPNKEIAPGYESVLIETKDGNSILGILREETGSELRVLSADSSMVRIPKDSIVSRQRAPSAMPDGLAELLSLQELRDLIEALSE